MTPLSQAIEAGGSERDILPERSISGKALLIPTGPGPLQCPLSFCLQLLRVQSLKGPLPTGLLRQAAPLLSLFLAPSLASVSTPLCLGLLSVLLWVSVSHFPSSLFFNFIPLYTLAGWVAPVSAGGGVSVYLSESLSFSLSVCPLLLSGSQQDPVGPVKGKGTY